MPFYPDFNALWQTIVYQDGWAEIAAFLAVIYMSFKITPWNRGIWCPNVVTLLGTLFRFVGFAGILFHVLGAEWKFDLSDGCFIYAIGFGFDALDGRMARRYTNRYNDGQVKKFQSFWSSFLYNGKSNYSGLWDSSNDKASAIPIFLVMTFFTFLLFDSVISTVLLILIAYIDTHSGIDKLAKFDPQAEAGTSHSAWVGKVKSGLEHASVIAWGLVSLLGEVFLIITLSLTLFFAIWSVVNRLKEERRQDVRFS